MKACFLAYIISINQKVLISIFHGQTACRDDPHWISRDGKPPLSYILLPPTLKSPVGNLTNLRAVDTHLIARFCTT
jgi:hypothetical protein